jgi:hypothetical protein
LAARLDIPGRLGIPGVVSLESSWDRYHFGGALAAPTGTSARRRATSLDFLGWVDPNVQARLGVRKEEWTAEGSFLSFSLENRLFQLEDRAIVTIGGAYAVPFGEARAYRQALSRLDWTSARLPTRTRWSARIGATWASATTPRGLWAVAGGDAGRAIPLRARQYAPDGLLPAARTGQSVVHAGLAGDQTVATIGLVNLGVGIFLDGADVRHAAGGSARHRQYLDGGIGLLISAAGASQRSLRLDLARGLQPVAGWRLSVGLDQPWTPRRGAGN